MNYDKDDDEDIGYFQDDDYVDDQGYFHGGGSESSKMSNSNVKYNKNLKLKMSKNDSIDSFKSARGDSLIWNFHLTWEYDSMNVAKYSYFLRQVNVL